MKIDKRKCVGCELCQPYCPVGAITTVEWEDRSVSEIDQRACVECGACLVRARVCPEDAIYMPQLEWPRSIRAFFSDPHIRHPLTDAQGRGTEEMKTNDVTGRYLRGIVGIGIEMGRPGIGTTLRDIQTISMALAKIGIEFESQNPVTALMTDKSTGKINEEVLNEKVLSAIIEFKIKLDQLEEVLEVINDTSNKIDTVFSLDLISRVNVDGTIPAIDIAKRVGYDHRPNTKTNIGMGRPLKEGA